MSNYTNGNYTEEEGDIGLKISMKSRVNGLVMLHVKGLSSSMNPRLTNEIERIAHTLSHSSFADTSTTSAGFPYTLGNMILGQ